MTIVGSGFDKWLPKKPINYQDYYSKDKRSLSDWLLSKKPEDCNQEELALRNDIIQKQVEDVKDRYRNNPEVLKALAEEYVSSSSKSASSSSTTGTFADDVLSLDELRDRMG